MSDAGATVREPDPSLGGTAVNQGDRAVQVEDRRHDRILTDEEVVEDLRRQIADLEGQKTSADADADRERRRADAANREREAAEARARDAEAAKRSSEASGARTVAEAQLDAVSMSLASFQGQLNNLKSQLVQAHEAGDLARVADVQADMVLVGGRIATLEGGKADLEERVKSTATAPVGGRQVDAPAARTEVAPEDRREGFIRAQPQRIQAWLRGEHGARFFSDPSFQQRVSAAASDANINLGIPIDSQQYIDYIEERVGVRQPSSASAAGSAGAAPGGTQGRQADDRRMVAAPAGGATGGSVRTPAGTTEIYLTKDEREMADRMGVSHSDWARQKRDLLAEGQIGSGARSR